MFYTAEGDWRPISEAYFAFSYAAEEHPDPEDDEESTSAEPAKKRGERKLKADRLEARLVMRALRSLRQFGILLPSGFVAKATDALVSAPSLKRSKTTHVDLLVGTVGSGTFWDLHWDEEDPAFQRIELERRYGIFLGCPVMVNAKEVDDAMTSVFPWHTNGSDLSPEEQERLIKATSKLDPERRSRGRPKHGDGVIEKMVHKEFSRRLGPAGDLHLEEKKMVVEAEAIAWVKKQTCDILEVRLSTMRAYLKPLYVLQAHGK